MNKNYRQNILNTMAEFSTAERPVYLVGGAVRDLVLDRPAHDLDFVLAGGTRALAQEVSCRLNGALYVLDEERDTTRVVLDPGDRKGERMLLDFAALRAGDLEGDLRARDFTINALAVDVARPDVLIDPTGGLADLREKRIRACTPDSLNHDPVRILRAIRQVLSLHFQIDPQTFQWMRAAAPLLTQPSAERLRDELFRMFDGPRVAVAIRLLDQAGALVYILPELEALKGVAQTAPHIEDVWEHTLSVVQNLEMLLATLVGTYREETVADLTLGSAVLWLGRFRKQFEEHFSRPLVTDRTLRSLLFLAALYHDIAKPDTRTVTAEGRVRFLQHPTRGTKMIARRARALALSTAEVSRLETIVEHHMRVHFLADAAVHEFALQDGALATAEGEEKGRPSRRAIYRFFKDTGETGVDIGLLSLADTRGTYGVTLTQDIWEAELQTCRVLFESYWEKSEEVVSPPRLLSGNDLIQQFGLQPGKTVGRLLSAIREAQAVGEVTNREEAEDFAQRWIQRHLESEEHSGEHGEE
jgi:tRNA nucleotidyltransferase/poly(A) polymerase